MQNMQNRSTLLARIYAQRLTIAALLALGAGTVLLTLAHNIGDEPGWDFWPFEEFGAILVGFGLLGMYVDFVAGRAKAAADQEMLDNGLKGAAPELVKAVLAAFADSPDAMRDIAPETLDRLATNALSRRLGDERFAAEVYADVRDQAIRAPEKWHDVDVSIRLSAIAERETRGGLPQFDATVQWSYSVVPAHTVRRFACVSDKDEYHELASDIPSTSTWFMTPRPGFRANDKAAFELVQFSVNGQPRDIRRRERKTGQTYSVDLGEDVLAAGVPVRLSYVYRTITPKHGHMLFFDIEQPTRGIAVEFDYSATDISHVSVLDLVASTKRTHVQRMPTSVPNKVVSATFDGWVFPRTGFAFVWTLEDELPADPAADQAELDTVQ